MSFLNTTIRSAFLTDLSLPHAGTNGRTAEEIRKLAFESALELMHDFLIWPRMNPLVTNVEIISDPQHPKYINVAQMAALFNVKLDSPDAVGPWVQAEITDTLNVLFGYTTELKYHSAMRPTLSGMEGLTDPGSGVKVYGKFELRKVEGDESVLHFVETNETKCNVFLAAYIKTTLGSSHKAMHENFKKKWNEEMKKKLAL